MVVLHVDTDELAQDDEHDGAREQGTDQRPEIAEDGVLVAKLQFAKREEVEQFPGSAYLPADRSSPPSCQLDGQSVSQLRDGSRSLRKFGVFRLCSFDQGFEQAVAD